LIDHNGKTVPVFFQITEDEKAMFVNRVASANPLVATATLNFQASSHVGVVEANISNSELVLSLESFLKGKAKISLIEFESLLETTVSNLRIDIVSRSNQPSSIDKVKEQIVTYVLENIKHQAVTNSGGAESPNADSGSDGALVDVKLALKLLKSSENTQIRYNVDTLSEIASVDVPLHLQTDRIDDPDWNFIDLASRYYDSPSGMDIKKGEMFSIVPIRWQRETIEYVDMPVDLSEENIAELHLEQKFRDLSDPRLVVKNSTVNNKVIAFGMWKHLTFPPILDPISYGKFRWVRTLKTAVRKPLDALPIGASFDALKTLQVSVSFSNMGERRFSLSSLVENSGKHNLWWSAVHDPMTGVLYFQANRDLGNVTFHDSLNKLDEEFARSGVAGADTDYAYSLEPVVLDKVAEVYSDYSFSSGEGKNKALGVGEKIYQEEVLKSDAKALIMQKIIKLKVNYPHVPTPEEVQIFDSLATPTARPALIESSPHSKLIDQKANSDLVPN
jgi:hypothetical protein